MLKTLLPPAHDDLAEGRYSLALFKVEAALGLEQAEDKSRLRRYHLLLLRKVGALPSLEAGALDDEELPPADPEAPWLDNERAWALLHDRPTWALDRFRDLLPRAPSRLDVALGEAEALRLLHRLTEARSLVENLKDRHGDHCDWKLEAVQLDVYQSRFKEACDRLEEVLSQAPHHERALHDKAMCLRDMGRRHEAQQVLDRHGPCCPKSILLRVARGWLRSDNSEWDHALDEFNRVLERGHRHPAAFVGKVMVHRRRGAAEEAKTLVNSADSDHIDPDVATQAGWVAYESAEYEVAVTAFERALSAHPYFPDALVGKVQALQQLGHPDKAKGTLLDAVAAVPDSRRLRRELGWHYVNNSGEHAKAVECFSAIRGENYQDAEATLGLATAYHFWGRYDDAEQELRRSLAHVPDHAGLRSELGWIQIKRGKYSEAISEFEKALQVDSTSEGPVQGKFTALSLLDRYDEIDALLAKYDREWHERPVLRLMRGQAAFTQARYDDALEEFQGILRVHKRHIDALVGQVAALRTLGRFSESESELAAAQRMFPDESRLHIEKGWLHFNRGDYDGALDCFERADPTENAFRGKAAVLRKRGEYDKASLLIEEALKYLQTSPPLLTEKGWILFDSGRYAESLSTFKRVLKISDEHREARQGQIASLARLQRYDQADQVLAAAIQDHSNSPVFRVEEGYLLLEQGRFDEAKAAFSRARKVSRHDENAVIGESIALRSMKKHEEALEVLDEEPARYGENPALRSERGWVLLDKGDPVHSIIEFERARASLPANDNAVLGSAIALRRLGRREEARELLMRHIQPGVFDNVLEAQLAWVYLESERWEEATKIFRKLAERGHMYREEARIGIAEAALRSGDRKEPGDDYEQLVLDMPGSAIAKVRLAAQLADQERARKVCLEAIQLEPRLAMAYDQLGIISTRAGEFEAAESYLQQSLNLDSSRSLAQIHLGWFYLRRSRLDTAAEHLRAALKSDPSDPDANILMGCVHLRAGVIGEADLHFSRALCAKPHDPVAIEGKARVVIAMRDWARAEQVLRDGLKAEPKDHRRDLHLLLARVLISRGDETKLRHFYEDALIEAQAAMDYSPGPSATNSHVPAPVTPETGDPWYFAAVASYRMSARCRAEGHTTGVNPRRDRYERRAVGYLNICLDQDHNPGHQEAAHLRSLLIDERRITAQALGQLIIALVAIALLVTMWIAFLDSNRVSQNTVVILSPILVGLLVITSLLPFLDRFKLPGVEAEVHSPPGDLESPPPLGDVSLGEIAAESLSPGADRATLPTAPQAPGNVRRHSAAVISVSAWVGETNNTVLAGKPAGEAVSAAAIAT